MESVLGSLTEFWEYVHSNMTVLDVFDISLVACGIYWLLMLIRGTRAIQIILGLLLLITASLASQLFQLSTLNWILENFLGSAVLIIIVLFQHDIRRALARVGGGFFPSVTARQESQILEEVVQAAKALSQKRVGALIVLERDNSLDEAVETGMFLDAAVSKEMLVSLFLPYSPLHDGAVIIQKGRMSHAGCILPLTLRADLPEGLGTRHRAALGITEETDAVVIVVSEETSMISVVMGGDITRGLDAPELRVVLQDILAGERRDLREMPTPAVVGGDNPLVQAITIEEDDDEGEPELEVDDPIDVAKATEG
jgi:diadenylate cyclase